MYPFMFLSWVFVSLEEINIVSEPSSILTQLPDSETFFSADCSVFSNLIFHAQVFTQVTVRYEHWITQICAAFML